MGLTDVLFWSYREQEKRGKERENLTWATTALRIACYSSEHRAEIRACVMLPDAFLVNWESSFFLDQTAQRGGMESKPNQKTGSLVWRSSCSIEAHESSSWEIKNVIMQLMEKQKKILQFLGNYSLCTFSSHLSQARRDSPENKYVLNADSMTTLRHTSMNSLCSLLQEQAPLLLITSPH